MIVLIGDKFCCLSIFNISIFFEYNSFYFLFHLKFNLQMIFFYFSWFLYLQSVYIVQKIKQTDSKNISSNIIYLRSHSNRFGLDITRSHSVLSLVSFSLGPSFFKSLVSVSVSPCYLNICWFKLLLQVAWIIFFTYFF